MGVGFQKKFCLFSFATFSLTSFLAVTSYAELRWTSDKYDVSLYGFIRPTYSLASSAVSSFGSASGSGSSLKWIRDNQVASTEAAPTLGVTRGDSARSSFGIGQSRVGLALNRDHVHGQLEMDFIDFDRAEATTAIRPRLRILGASVDLPQRLSLFAGQDWDIISGPKPFTCNYVSLNFRSGNTGFMRTQFRLTLKDDSHAEIASWALGAAGLNDSDSSASAVERGVAPVVGFRYNPVRFKTLTAGLAGLATARRLEPTADSQTPKTREAWLFKLFADYQALESLKLRAQAFGGTNAQSTGSVLSLATATTTGSQSELGGFVSAQWSMSKDWDVFGGGGIDQLIGAYEDRAGQLIRNVVGRVGSSWQFAPRTKLCGEVTYFNSLYQWPAATDQLRATAFQFEAGLNVEI